MQTSSLTGWRATPSWARWTLLSVIVVGAFFRLYRLEERGSLRQDEATYLVESRLMWGAEKLVLNKWGIYQRETPQQILNQMALHTYSHVTAKPMNAFLGSLGLWALGDDISSVQYVSAVFGIVMIPLLFVFVLRLFRDVELAAIASALLAISPAHVSYSRYWWPESDATVFLYLAAWCYYEGVLSHTAGASHRWKWGSGLLGGLAFTCNTRWAFILPLFLLFMTAEAFWRRNTVPHIALNCVRVFVAFLLILAVWEVPYHFAMLAQKNTGMAMRPFYTFWETLPMRFKYATPDWEFRTFPSYAYLLGRSEGLIGLLAMVGLAGAFLRSPKTFEWALVASFVAITFVFFWSVQFKVLVYLTAALPAFCALAALGCQQVLSPELWKKYPHFRKLAAALIGVAIISLAMVSDWKDLSNRSQLKNAVGWLIQNRPNQRVLATSYESTLCEYDLAHVAPLPVPVSVEYLRNAYQAGFRLLMIDAQKFSAVLGDKYDVERNLLPHGEAFATPLIAAIEISTKPLMTFTNDFNSAYLFLFARDHNLSLSKTRLFLRTVDPTRDLAIRIYDLDEVLQNLQAYDPSRPSSVILRQRVE